MSTYNVLNNVYPSNFWTYSQWVAIELYHIAGICCGRAIFAYFVAKYDLQKFSPQNVLCVCMNCLHISSTTTWWSIFKLFHKDSYQFWRAYCPPWSSQLLSVSLTSSFQDVQRTIISRVGIQHISSTLVNLLKCNGLLLYSSASACSSMHIGTTSTGMN